MNARAPEGRLPEEFTRGNAGSAETGRSSCLRKLYYCLGLVRGGKKRQVNRSTSMFTFYAKKQLTTYNTIATNSNRHTVVRNKREQVALGHETCPHVMIFLSQLKDPYHIFHLMFISSKYSSIIRSLADHYCH